MPGFVVDLLWRSIFSNNIEEVGDHARIRVSQDIVDVIKAVIRYLE
jgi:hypothetical protein